MNDDMPETEIVESPNKNDFFLQTLQRDFIKRTRAGIAVDDLLEELNGYAEDPKGIRWVLNHPLLRGLSFQQFPVIRDAMRSIVSTEDDAAENDSDVLNVSPRRGAPRW